MNQEEIQAVSFEIILASGDARTNIHEAFAFMRKGEYQEAEEKLDEANEGILKAHQSQTGLLQQYAEGQTITVEVLLVHAQDHLMTTMTLREVALEMLALYQKVS
ncbi:PTS system, cellobiose-specific IIA component [Granulicatella balaenopterae]|uniref:PTS system, cellobiose-specific IIA component n=1 Tax=Granulicatella balaenopterae TaxID=137733 RepID=A0A1H9N360_9LACT|nr:PTS cellobiose transporter subunit IIA [Granulicatella balaenopterae]SER30416.1 PTS system, cellobiose-specific IIA component [Granulicatella balaenopterae]